MATLRTKTVDRALDILELFDDLNTGKNLNEISEALDISISTAYRIVSTLENRKFLRKDKESKLYYVGERLARYGSDLAKDEYELLKEVSFPCMHKLHEKYNENIALFISEGENKVCIERLESTKALRHVELIGSKATLKKGSVGKVFLAFFTEEETSRINLDETWPNQIELAKVRKQGYALSVGEREEGLVGLSAPIFKEDRCIGVISMSGPVGRIINDSLVEKINDILNCSKKITNILNS